MQTSQKAHKKTIIAATSMLMRQRKHQWLVSGIALGLVVLKTILIRSRNIGFSSSKTDLLMMQPTLAATELPGYTGWARPASTVAGQFRIRNQDQQATIHQDWTVTMTCDACSSSSSSPERRPLFYARAYGPAIITGVVELQEGKDYVARFHPTVAGQYTVEVVLDYSHPLDPDSFPLTKEQLPPPYYEGYILAGFPVQITVKGAATRKGRKSYCSVDQLSLSMYDASTPLWKQAAWRVTSTNTHVGVHSEAYPTNVTLRGYQWGRNSLGFTAAYEYTDCLLVVDQLADFVEQSSCVTAKDKLHIILIGDSVMRLQKLWLEQHLSPDKATVTFMELYGGALRCSRLSGPNVTSLHASVPDASRTIVLFNSGMHDIHRLCGHSWIDDRPLYLTKAELQVSCTTVYRTAIRDLAMDVLRIPAAAHMFQTTSAAWPKYGNYGIAWDPRYAQELPLDASFVKRFNTIAVGVIQRLNDSTLIPINLTMVDSYWMTLARPDNRETNKKADIGKKLSHPGPEVVRAAAEANIMQPSHERRSSGYDPWLSVFFDGLIGVRVLGEPVSVPCSDWLRGRRTGSGNGLRTRRKLVVSTIYLLEAEISAAREDHARVPAKFVSAANEAGFLRQIALTNEREGKYYLYENKGEKTATTHLRECLLYYEQ